jgi:hypothetical protein
VAGLGEETAHLLLCGRQLLVAVGRPDAIRFYESLGFVASHEGMKLHLREATRENCGG